MLACFWIAACSSPCAGSSQRGDLADDIAAALEANPAAGAFFDTVVQFYRKAYLR